MSENLSQKEIEQKAYDDALAKYNLKNGENNIATNIPTQQPLNQETFQQQMSKETDEDLIVNFDIVTLPSKGVFYPHKISEINVEYLTSIDEDVLTTPSLIENGTVLNILLRRKIKTKGVNPDELLSGDRSAILLFLRSSSYGHEYHVEVPDPRTGKLFKAVVDLRKMGYKKVDRLPDENGYFMFHLPMRDKMVKYKLLSSVQEENLFKNAEARKEAYNQEHSDYASSKLKSHIVDINGNSDHSYISKFIDAMPAGDSMKLRRDILDVSPDIDMRYEFTAKDGFKFTAPLTAGIDFFFPSL